MKVELHKRKFSRVQSVIFINDEFATDSELTTIWKLPSVTVESTVEYILLNSLKIPNVFYYTINKCSCRSGVASECGPRRAVLADGKRANIVTKSHAKSDCNVTVPCLPTIKTKLYSERIPIVITLGLRLRQFVVQLC